MRPVDPEMDYRVSNIEIEFTDSPIKFEEIFPLKKIYVVDRYLPTSLHRWFDHSYRSKQIWQKSNQVQDPSSTTGRPHHELWGASILGSGEKPDPDQYDPRVAWPMLWLSSKLQNDFGFKWKKFSYAGLNSQVTNMDGTMHNDCEKKCEWNCSFLYYMNPNWDTTWGGNLNIYSNLTYGMNLSNDIGRKNNINTIEFVPNRLIIFDGRIPHQADGPTPNAKYIDRRSTVIRGDEIRLLNKEEIYHANY